MTNLSNFAERLSEYMAETKDTAEQLSIKIGFDRSSVSGWKRGAHIPSGEAVYALVEYFHCSADYLLGRADYEIDGVTFLPPVDDFGLQLRKIMAETKTSQYHLTKAHGISGKLLYRWLHGKLPNAENLVKLANCMGITVDYLLGRTNDYQLKNG